MLRIRNREKRDSLCGRIRLKRVYRRNHAVHIRFHAFPSFLQQFLGRQSGKFCKIIADVQIV